MAGFGADPKKIGKYDNIINPLQGLSEKPVDRGIGQTKASKPDHKSQIKYIFLNFKAVWTKKKFNFYIFYLLKFISFHGSHGKSRSHRVLGLIIGWRRPPAAMRQFAATLWLDTDTTISL